MGQDNISPDPNQMVYDACVVGAGPAGIIFCLELSKLRPDFKILLLDYGKEVPGQGSLDESIEILNPVNHHHPSECTNKGFGGTSATWGGRCVSYDEIDFLPRPIIGDECTWNLESFENTRKFYPVAAKYMESGDPLFTVEECFPNEKAHISEKFVAGEISDSFLERWSMPTRFAGRYREEIQQSENVLHVEPIEVHSLVPSADSDNIRVEGVLRDTGASKSYTARNVIVATGAQEATRLLFRSEALFSDAGGFPESLGLYYQGHISGKIASIVFSGDPKQTDYGFLSHDGVYVRRRFQFSADLLIRENLLNTALWLDNPLYSDPSHRNGTMSLIYLMMLMPVIGKRLAPPAIAESIKKGRKASVWPHLVNIARGFPKSLFEPAMIFFKRYFPARKLPGVFLYNSENRYALHYHAEQVPIKENYIKLSEDGKTLQIQYSYCKEDVDSVIRTHKLLDDWLRKTGAGYLDYWYPENSLPEKITSQSRDGIHQVGTTRMSIQPDEGVVDPDLRLWTGKSVYVCSSSVFPTSGQANPTFLLGAFAARLAEHISRL